MQPPEQDWQEVVFKRKKPAARSAHDPVAAKSQGVEVVTEKKFTTGNKHAAPSSSARKLDQFTGGEDEELPVHTVSLSVSRAIQQARQAKGWTQKELATKINEQASVINSYEAGKAVPSNQVLAKLERQLGVKLRGKDIGKPLAP